MDAMLMLKNKTFHMMPQIIRARYPIDKMYLIDEAFDEIFAMKSPVLAQACFHAGLTRKKLLQIYGVESPGRKASPEVLKLLKKYLSLSDLHVEKDLGYYCLIGDYKMVEKLLSVPETRILRDFKDDRYVHSIHMAIKNDDVNMLKMFESFETGINISDMPIKITSDMSGDMILTLIDLFDFDDENFAKNYNADRLIAEKHYPAIMRLTTHGPNDRPLMCNEYIAILDWYEQIYSKKWNIDITNFYWNELIARLKFHEFEDMKAIKKCSDKVMEMMETSYRLMSAIRTANIGTPDSMVDYFD